MKTKPIKIPLIVLISLFILIPASSFVRGENQSDPILIHNVQELQAIKNNPAASYELANDIDASETKNWNGGLGFEPIWYFSGRFDGKNHKIKNLFINRITEENVGLFRKIHSGGVIEDLILEDVDIIGRWKVGAFFGENYGALKKCHASGRLEAITNVVGGIGGISGLGSLIEDCSALVELKGYASGGIVAGVFEAKLLQSYSEGKILGESRGFAGGGAAGGIAAEVWKGIVERSYSTMTILHSEAELGIGGLIGHFYGGSRISDSYATGEVEGKDNVGGLVGRAELGIIERSYSVGKIHGQTNIGGLIGYRDETQVISSYWDIETSEVAVSAGGEGKTTVQMKKKDTFVNWDFQQIWNILEDVTYPFLRWEGVKRILPDEAADLAKEVVDAPYLGDGKIWGGKGFECKARKFVDPTEIKTTGYYYYDGRIRDCSSEKGKGVDCSGLSFWSYNRAYYGDKWISGKEYEYNLPLLYEGAAKQYEDNTIEIKKEELKLGDLLFFDTNKNGFMDHVAMYIGGETNNVIHASGFTWTITFATFDSKTEKLITVKPTGETQFLKVDAYGRVVDPKIEFRISATSPIDLIVTDPEGFITTIENPWDGPMEYQVYDINEDGELDDLVVTGKRKIGSYLITVVPEADASLADTYTLKAEALINGKTTTVILAEDVPISDIPRTPYIIRSTETEIIPIIPTILAFVDFNPDTLNLKSKGKYVTIYIELPLGYNISEINLESIRLNGQIQAEPEPAEIGDYNNNGTPDLMVKFNQLAVRAILEIGDKVEIIITSELIDGKLFQGSDTIKVISVK